MQRMFDLFDVVRIDHFRAVDSAWAIPADHPTARDGAWAPGRATLLEAIRAPEGKHLVAEDLGIIPQSVLDLRDRHGLPGMAVLHFADEQPTNPHRPSITPRTPWCTPARTTTTPRSAGGNVHCRTFCAMPCLSGLPCRRSLQDVLGLGSEARMNIPGTVDGNWTWRFAWPDLDSSEVIHFRAAVAIHRPS